MVSPASDKQSWKERIGRGSIVIGGTAFFALAAFGLALGGIVAALSRVVDPVLAAILVSIMCAFVALVLSVLKMRR
jgi:hypothetical protein